MTKEEILEAVQECARKLGRNPNLRDLRKMTGVNESDLYRKVGNLKKALTEAGLKVSGSGFYSGRSELLLDWAAVVRKLGKLPTVVAYEREGNFTSQPMRDRFGSWTTMGETFREFATEEKIQRQWKDVLEIIEKQEMRQRRTGEGRTRRKCPLLMDRPVYGAPLNLPELAYEPANEFGVVFLFAVMARQLGFEVHRLQADFPDCEAMREMAKGQWQRVRIEFEFESRNFAVHKHDPKKCDVIVCWVHNWADCPETIDVLELKRVMEGGEMGTGGR